MLHFEAEAVGGELKPGDETTEVRYFSRSEAEPLAMNELDRQRVTGGFAGRVAAIVCDDFLQEA